MSVRSLAAALTALILGVAASAPAAEMPRQPAYVGSASCAGCHGGIEPGWAGSDHGLAWTLPSETTVLGDFADASFESRGTTTRFTRRGDAFVVETDGKSYDVVGVAGIRPLQQYLLAPAPGRTQAFDIAWDTARGRWYDLYPDQVTPPGDGMHWTGPYKSWEARCAECHATGYSRNYDVRAKRYDPHMAEIGVGCEACHGPGEAHAAWAAAPEGFDPGAWPGVTAHGLTVDLGASAEAEIGQCAGCHSRREAFFDGNPEPGTPYHDAYSLALLRDGVYEADGQIDAEDYELGSFLQAKMYARGVRCSDCHDPHALELRAEGNAVCTQCHSPAGNARFPTLRQALYADPAHTFHAPGTEGAACKSCHMPERNYMGVDRRRDHGFRVPRPDLSATTGAPDVCTSCHADKDAAWAASEISLRFPDSAHRGVSFATTFAAARRDPAAEAEALVALAEREDLAGIVRASALELLAQSGDPGGADRVAGLLADPDPLVRGAAATVQRALPAGPRLERLTPALSDPVRAVRVAAAKAMLGADVAGAPEASRAALAAASGEWSSALRARADFPETHLQVGGAALTRRNLEVAVAAFREAVTLDPQLVDGWAMIARIHAATGDAEGARRALDEGLAANPGQGDLEAMRRELGG